MPNSKVAYVDGAEADSRSYRVEFDKIARMLPEFKPEWTVPLGARQLYDAYTRVGLLLEDFEGPRFRRISNLENSLRSGRLDSNLRRIN